MPSHLYRIPESTAARLKLMLIPAFFGACLLIVAAYTAVPARYWDAALHPACSVQTLDRLYFGTDVRVDPGHLSDIDEVRWQAFMDTQVTPNFPDGLTVLYGDGQWKNRAGTIERESARVVEIVHRSGARADRKIDGLISHYKQAFNQQSVLRLTTTVAACS